jgi:class 3 adenylate cyclase
LASPLRQSLRKLAEVHDEPRFRSAMRNTALVGFGVAVVAEAAAYLSPEFPKDMLGSAIMSAAFLACAVAAHRNVSRRALGAMSAALFGVLGWYLARAIFASGDAASPHRDAIYATLAGAQAVLMFSAIEFIAVTLMMFGAFIVTAIATTGVRAGDFGLMYFYAAAFVAVSVVGIAARQRLQRSELQARGELEALNQNLEAEVERQVERIQRAQMLGRFLPRELSERVLDGEGGDELAHARREVTVLCAAPSGFLESLNTLEAEQVVPLVNSFVSAMARLAHDHAGVIERFVGPRITVLFGAIQAQDTTASARAAAEMAHAMQHECNRLLAQWEREGLATLRLRMAVGIAAGTTVVGTFGSERRVEYSALGEAMVRAHRLASIAIPGEVRFDDVAAQRLEGVVELAPAAAVELSPGRESPTFVLPAEAADTGTFERVVDGAAITATSGDEAALLETLHESDAAGSASGRKRGPQLPKLADGALFDGRYRIESLLGTGGMAAVYKARHVSLNQLRALKLIAPGMLASAHAVEQLRHEAEATARIHHPNVVKLHDFGRSIEGHYYLALDLVSGRSLAELLRAGPLREQRAVAVAIDILAALQAAHELRLVHRDVKPANVLIDVADRVRVTDFGLSQPHGASIDPTRPVIVGTPAYMSPEQCQGRALDGRSDLYSFGVTFYEMLCGTHPYRVRTPGELLLAVIQEEPVPLHERAPELSAELWATIARCLRKDPAQRPRSAHEVRRDLEAWYGMRVTA